MQELQLLFGQDRRDHPNAGDVSAGLVEAGEDLFARSGE
jgi:hypothetical protein